MDYFNSQCGYVSRRGRECGYWAMEDSPVNLCRDHLLEAHRFAEEIIPGISRRTFTNDYRCGSCGTLTVYTIRGMPDMLMCSRCGVEAAKSKFAMNMRKIRALERKPADETNAIVYYVQHGERIKIGTTTNWRNRMGVIPHDRILAFEPGWRPVEKQRHAQFEAHRYGATEWFQPHDALWDHIIELNEMHPEFQTDIDEHNSRIRNELRGGGSREVA